MIFVVIIPLFGGRCLPVIMQMKSDADSLFTRNLKFCLLSETRRVTPLGH
ncbi:hypothetical protein C7433_101496 [Pantoea sp. PNA 03-3]|nr:hypothetical protein C7433_101496 [Pantoea sp. PNA 03-3]